MAFTTNSIPQHLYVGQSDGDEPGKFLRVRTCSWKYITYTVLHGKWQFLSALYCRVSSLPTPIDSAKSRLAAQYDSKSPGTPVKILWKMAGSKVYIEWTISCGSITNCFTTGAAPRNSLSWVNSAWDAKVWEHWKTIYNVTQSNPLHTPQLIQSDKRQVHQTLDISCL